MSDSYQLELLAGDEYDVVTGEYQREVVEVGGKYYPNLSDQVVQALANQDLINRFLSYGAAFGDLSKFSDIDFTGATDSTAALQSAINTTIAAGLRPFARGVVKTSAPITVSSSCELEDLTINYTGTGTAVKAGSPSLGVVTSRKRFNLPKVVCTSRPGSGWDGSSVGVELLNLNDCTVIYPYVQGFEIGVFCRGNGQGFAYNKIHCGTLWLNHKQMVLQSNDSGWANKNTFIGGRWQSTLSNGAFVDDPDACQVLLAPTVVGSGGPPNDNVWISCSFEDSGTNFYTLDISGPYNIFIGCRYERPVAYPPRVMYRSTAGNSRIQGGYDAYKIIEYFEGAMVSGTAMDDTLGSFAAATSTAGQVIPNATVTRINQWGTPQTRRCDYDGDGIFIPRPGRWNISATVTFMPNATGTRRAYLSAGGSSLDFDEKPGGSTPNSLKLSGSYRFDSVKTFSVSVYQNSGADLALSGTSPYVNITADLIGA